MGTIATSDGTQILQGLRLWAAGGVQPRLALNADAWDDQAMLVASNGYRAIAHDRRANGRSSQPWTGHELNTYADDLAQLIEQLDLREVVLVGHEPRLPELCLDLGDQAQALLVAAAQPGSTRPGPGCRWRVRAAVAAPPPARPP